MHLKFNEDLNIGDRPILKYALTLADYEREIGKGLTIVETGTTRGNQGNGPKGDGWASLLFAWYTYIYGGSFTTVDLNQGCLNECKRITKEYNKNTTYVRSDSVKFLEKFDKHIDILYLDSAMSPKVMFSEFKAAEKNLGINSIVVMDDCLPDFKHGKGTILGPYLLKQEDWTLIKHECVEGIYNTAMFANLWGKS